MRKIKFRRFPKIECGCGGVFRPSYKDLFPLKCNLSPYKTLKTHCYCPYCDSMYEILALSDDDQSLPIPFYL